LGVFRMQTGPVLQRRVLIRTHKVMRASMKKQKAQSF